MGLFGDIVEHVKEQKGLWLRYPPGEPISLGDIVVKDEGLWVRIGNVADDLDFKIETTEPYDTEDTWVSQSDSGITLDAKASGEASDALSLLADGEAGVYVKFSQGGKYLLALKGVSFVSVKSIDAFWAKIKEKRRLSTWDRRRKIVTTVVHATSGTFLMSGEGDTTFGLKAKADTTPPTNPVGTAEIAAGFDLAKQFSAADSFVAKAGFSPLFRLHKVTVLGGNKFAALGETALEQDDEG